MSHYGDGCSPARMATPGAQAGDCAALVGLRLEMVRVERSYHLESNGPGPVVIAL